MACDRTVGRSASISMRTYTEGHLAHIPLLRASDISDLCNRIEPNDWGLGLETLVEHGRTHRLYVYSERINEGTIRQLLEDLADLARADAAGVEAVAALRREEIALEAELKLLARRVRDPHP